MLYIVAIQILNQIDEVVFLNIVVVLHYKDTCMALHTWTSPYENFS